MELSKAQLNYILAIKQLVGGKVTQKYICEYLGVKKSTASIALKNLEENGYINKSENNYILTEKSWETRLIEKSLNLCRYLMAFLA